MKRTGDVQSMQQRNLGDVNIVFQYLEVLPMEDMESCMEFTRRYTVYLTVKGYTF